MLLQVAHEIAEILFSPIVHGLDRGRLAHLHNTGKYGTHLVNGNAGIPPQNLFLVRLPREFLHLTLYRLKKLPHVVELLGRNRDAGIFQDEGELGQQVVQVDVHIAEEILVERHEMHHAVFDFVDLYNRVGHVDVEHILL